MREEWVAVRQYPGERLRNAVDAVLAELTVTGSPDRELLDHFEETLRAGLAWTAATGDTCRFGRAVTAVREWPVRRLVITAVDAADGRRVTFDASSGVALHDALAATSALPGLFPLAPIGGGLFADGGLSSPYNADLAAGCDSVTVLSPLPVNVYLRRLLEAETAALGDAHVRVIIADQVALAAIGPDSLSIDAAPAALEAGMAQAERELG